MITPPDITYLCTLMRIIGRRDQLLYIADSAYAQSTHLYDKETPDDASVDAYTLALYQCGTNLSTDEVDVLSDRLGDHLPSSVKSSRNIWQFFEGLEIRCILSDTKVDFLRQLLLSIERKPLWESMVRTMSGSPRVDDEPPPTSYHRILAGAIQELPFSIRHRITNILDATDEGGNTWKDFGRCVLGQTFTHVEMTAMLTIFEKKTNSSPSEEVLNHWQVKRGATIGKMIHVLKMLDMVDTARAIFDICTDHS